MGGWGGWSGVLTWGVSCVVHLLVFYLFTCLFVFSEADLVTFFGCLCWKNEVKTVDLQSQIWRRRRIQSALDMWAPFLCVLSVFLYYPHVQRKFSHSIGNTLIYGDAFRCLDKVGPTHFQVGAPVRSCSWSPVGGQGLLCVLLPQFFVTAPHTVQHQNLVPGVPVTADSAPPGLSLTSAPRFFFLKFELTDAATGNKGNWLKIPSHHIPPCLSTPEPPAEILSLNYCTQHIPVNRTHAYMRAHTAKTSQLTNKSKLMAAFPTHAPTLVPGSARQGLFVFAGGQKKGKATFYVSKITSLSVICSHNSSVRWRQVDSAQFHISDFHDSLICWALKNKWSSPIKKF